MTIPVEPGNTFAWTYETLRSYFDAKIDGLALIVDERDTAMTVRVQGNKDQQALALQAEKERVVLALVAADKAIAKAETAIDKRIDGLNELRSAMTDQQKNFAEKNETNYKFTAFEKRLDEAHATNTKRLDMIEHTMANSVGRTAGTSQVAAIIVQIISSAGTLVAMGLALYAITKTPY